MARDNLDILGRSWTVEWVDDLGDNFGECDLAPGTIGALFDAIDVTEVGPHERLAHLGLAIITEEAA